MDNKNEQIFKIYIRSAFDRFEKYFIRGNKENLMALIGCLYSTRLEKIERISYEEVKEIPKDLKEIKYYISSKGDIRISYIPQPKEIDTNELNEIER